MCVCVCVRVCCCCFCKKKIAYFVTLSLCVWEQCIYFAITAILNFINVFHRKINNIQKWHGLVLYRQLIITKAIPQSRSNNVSYRSKKKISIHTVRVNGFDFWKTKRFYYWNTYWGNHWGILSTYAISNKFHVDIIGIYSYLLSEAIKLVGNTIILVYQPVVGPTVA